MPMLISKSPPALPLSLLKVYPLYHETSTTTHVTRQCSRTKIATHIPIEMPSQQPSPPLKSDPIIIVGAGIFGLSTGLHLARRGYIDVTVSTSSRTTAHSTRISTDATPHRLTSTRLFDAGTVHRRFISPLLWNRSRNGIYGTKN